MNTNRRDLCCQAPQRAYLVRCWREEGDITGDVAHWRFSAEEVLTRQPRRGFDDLEALFRYLEAEMTEGEDELAG